MMIMINIVKIFLISALTFIDKYTQVPRILNPIVQVIEAIPRCAETGHVKDMMEAAHGGVEECQLDILQDFFKHAFDGSGADNFYDAGSCIDGRLTRYKQSSSTPGISHLFQCMELV